METDPDRCPRRSSTVKQPMFLRAFRPTDGWTDTGSTSRRPQADPELFRVLRVQRSPVTAPLATSRQVAYKESSDDRRIVQRTASKGRFWLALHALRGRPDRRHPRQGLKGRAVITAPRPMPHRRAGHFFEEQLLSGIRSIQVGGRSPRRRLKLIKQPAVPVEAESAPIVW